MTKTPLRLGWCSLLLVGLVGCTPAPAAPTPVAHTDTSLAAILAGVSVDDVALKPVDAGELAEMRSEAGVNQETTTYDPAACGAAHQRLSDAIAELPMAMAMAATSQRGIALTALPDDAAAAAVVPVLSATFTDCARVTLGYEGVEQKMTSTPVTITSTAVTSPVGGLVVSTDPPIRTLQLNGFVGRVMVTVTTTTEAATDPDLTEAVAVLDTVAAAVAKAGTTK